MTAADFSSTSETGHSSSLASRTADVLLREITPVLSAPAAQAGTVAHTYAGWAWNLAKDVMLAHLPQLTLVEGVEHAIANAATPSSAKTPSLTKLNKPGDYEETISVNGSDRTFTVHVPVTKDASKRKPMVVMLHGITENGSSFADETQMNKKADAAGFVVVYPNGSKLGASGQYCAWNVPNWGSFNPAKKADDVPFIEAIMDQVPKQTPIARDRIYLAGFSNGGMLAQQVALAAPDKVAAIALVGADLSGKDLIPKRGLSVLDIHGTRDVTNYGSLLNDTGVLSMQRPGFTFDFWSRANKINAVPKIQETSGLTVLDGKNPVSGAEVKQVLIDGGSHTWPRPQARRPQDRQLVATDAVWDFFSTHRKSTVTV